MNKIYISSKSFRKDAIEHTENKKEAIGLIAGTEEINLVDYPKLKVISRYGSGMDNIDLKECEKRGIEVYNTPEAPADSVAELTLLLILQLLRNDKELLFGKTVGIIGLGNIGGVVDYMLKSLENRTMTFDTKKNQWDMYDKILEECDIITIHVPLNAESYMMVDWCFFDVCKKRPYIINTSRKEIVDERAMRLALINDKCRGFASDVNNAENFIEFDNVIITDHIGSDTKECRKQMEKQCINNLLEGLK